MRDVIYLVCDRARVVKMTKSVPELHRGEIPIKVQVTIDQAAFSQPTIEQKIHLTDWTEGIDAAMVDLEMKRPFVTPDEVQVLKARRIKELAKMLAATGRYKVEELPGDVEG